MMIKDDYSFYDLMDTVWENAKDTMNTIYENDFEDEFMDLLESMFYETTPTLTEVNDWLSYDWEDIYSALGINGEDEDEEDEDDFEIENEEEEIESEEL